MQLFENQMSETREAEIWDVIVIGGGPAGLTAGMYTARSRLKTKILVGPTPGGQISFTYRIDNYPGFYEPITGPEFTEKLMKHAEIFEADLDRHEATSIDLNEQPYRITAGNMKLKARAVIIATGSQNRKLGVLGEEKFMGKGVFVCATCDAALYQDLRVVIVGGGDSALQEALDLTKFAAEVYIVHRGEDFTACLCLQNRVKESPKIKIIHKTVVEEIIGEEYVEAVKLKDLDNGETKELETNGVLIAIGWVPNTELLKGKLEIKPNGYLKVDGVKTGKPGIFVAGDINDTEYRQVVTACSSGCKAALEAERFIMSQG
jgi:thioredoxin reductase (NADPH)